MEWDGWATSLPDTNSTTVPTTSLAKNTTDADGLAFYKFCQFATALVGFPLLCTVGLLTNTITFFVLRNPSIQRTTTSILLRALAVSDICKLLNDLMYVVAVVLLLREPRVATEFFVRVYPYAHYCFQLFNSTSSWLVVTLALERFLLVCQPTRASQLSTEKSAYMYCAVIFMSLSILMIPSALRYVPSTDTIHQQEGSQDQDVGKNSPPPHLDVSELWDDQNRAILITLFQSMVRSIIPLLLVLILNACIIRGLQKKRANKKIAGRRRITLMLVVIMAVFVVCITPDAVLSLCGYGYADTDYFIRGLREITDYLMTLKGGTNFVTYCVFNPRYRLQLARIFSLKRCLNCTCLSVKPDSKRRAARGRKKGGTGTGEMETPGFSAQQKTYGGRLELGGDWDGNETVSAGLQKNAPRKLEERRGARNIAHTDVELAVACTTPRCMKTGSYGGVGGRMKGARDYMIADNGHACDCFDHSQCHQSEIDSIDRSFYDQEEKKPQDTEAIDTGR